MNWIVLFLGLYAAVVVLMFFMQERLIFVGAYWRSAGEVEKVAGVEVEWLEFADDAGRFRVARARPVEAARGVVVCFLGNGEDLRSGVYQAREWMLYGLESIVVEYPGYGASEGSPGIESIYSAADAAARLAAERAAELGVPLFAAGQSLGTFSAVFVASRHPVVRLVLAAPPTSLVAAARSQYPWLPIGWLLRHRFDSLSLAPEIACSTLVLHGDQDSVVPQRMGRELHDAFGGPCDFVDARGHGHMLPLHRAGPFGSRIRSFLDL